MRSQPRGLWCKNRVSIMQKPTTLTLAVRNPSAPLSRGRETYYEHLMKVLFKLIDIGVCLQALCVRRHASLHELIILLHQETTFQDLFTLPYELQSTKC